MRTIQMVSALCVALTVGAALAVMKDGAPRPLSAGDQAFAIITAEQGRFRDREWQARRDAQESFVPRWAEEVAVKVGSRFTVTCPAPPMVASTPVTGELDRLLPGWRELDARLIEPPQEHRARYIRARRAVAALPLTACERRVVGEGLERMLGCQGVISAESRAASYYAELMAFPEAERQGLDL